MSAADTPVACCRDCVALDLHRRYGPCACPCHRPEPEIVTLRRDLEVTRAELALQRARADRFEADYHSACRRLEDLGVEAPR